VLKALHRAASVRGRYPNRLIQPQVNRPSDRRALLGRGAQRLGRVRPPAAHARGLPERADLPRDDGLATDEREELRRLRREDRRLQQERDLLKRAAAFFAAETETR
jgi:transposase-like protein